MADESETTNAVLAEKIGSLTKLTDERFGSVKDTLVDIKDLLKGFALKTELEEAKKDFTASVKRIEEAFVQHNKDDKDSFAKMEKSQQEIRDTIKMWVGALAIMAFLFPLIIPLALHYILK